MSTTRVAHSGAQRTSTSAEPSSRRQATRQRLMDAAVELFAERGVLGSSVEEICERAGFTRGAFYSNFDSKDELCLAVMQHKCDERMSGMAAAIAVLPEDRAEVGELDPMIRTAVDVFMQTMPQSATDLVAMMELRLHAMRTPELRPGWIALNNAVEQSVVDQLDQALQRAGARLRMPSLDVVHLLVALFEHAVGLRVLGADDSSGRLADEMVAVLQALIEPA